MNYRDFAADDDSNGPIFFVRALEAPQSGSIEQNGRAAAEQIGGQIFIDTWGLAAPGNPDLAVALAEKAASVTHGGNGVYGGMFVAACISFAFLEQDIRSIIRKGLSYIPDHCEYSQVVHAVMDYYDENPDDWKSCYRYISRQTELTAVILSIRDLHMPSEFVQNI